MVSENRFAWVLNLDAELELERPSHNSPRRLLQQLADYGRGAQALLGPNDVLLPSNHGRGVFGGKARSFLGRAWCPTPRALARFRHAGITPEAHPTAEVLRRVNHRLFALELGGGLPEQRYVTGRSALDQLIVRATGPLLLKRPLAFAGRGQQRIFSTPDEKQWSWIDASLRLGGILVEPLVTPELEVSLHGFIERAGAFSLGGPCVQDVSDRGVFRGIRRAEPNELSSREEGALTESALRAGQALAEAGYFGPFGIDGYRYAGADAARFCALGEINARYSMGFVSGFPRHPSELSLGPA